MDQNSVRFKLSKKVLGLIATGALAPVIATQFISEREGVRLEAYRDGGGIATICYGHTEGVVMGMRATQLQCDRWLQEDVEKATALVDRYVTKPMTEPQKAAVISFCAFNLGMGKCRTSTFLRLLNEGKPAPEVCPQIKRWIMDGGRDCRIRENNCYGQIERRELEYQLCSM